MALNTNESPADQCAARHIGLEIVRDRGHADQYGVPRQESASASGPASRRFADTLRCTHSSPLKSSPPKEVIMSKRTPHVFSFESPYELTDTVDTFRDVLCDVYAGYAGRDVVLALQPDQAPPLTSELYVRAPAAPHSPGHDLIEFVVGNRAHTYWAATITFVQNGSLTLGEVNLDRPKIDLRRTAAGFKLNEYLVLRDRLPGALRSRLGFIITKLDFS